MNGKLAGPDSPPPRVLAALGSAGGLFFRFMLSGLPSFALAVPLNWLLVTKAGIHPMVAYAAVLVLQMTTNFIICRRFVFRLQDQRAFFPQYFSFVAGNSVIRTADWALYSFLVSLRPNLFLAIQVANVGIFAIVKFLFARFIFSRIKAKS